MPIKHHHLHPEGQFYGSVTVGEKGQIVIPQEAREKMKLKKGDRMLVFGMDEDILMEFDGPRERKIIVTIRYDNNSEKRKIRKGVEVCCES